MQTARSIKNTRRDPSGIMASLAEAVLLEIIARWIFVRTDETLSGIRICQGALYCAAVLQRYLVLLQETHRLSSDITLFDNERMDGVVGVSSFLLSRRLSRLLLEDIAVPLIFCLISYFFVCFRLMSTQLFVFYAMALLCHFVSVAFAAVCVAAVRDDFPRPGLIANLSFTLQSVCRN